jgi:FkbM family methyltransferase
VKRIRGTIRQALARVAPALAARLVRRSLLGEAFGLGMRHEPELHLLPELTSLGGLAIDVGANVGNYSVLLATLRGQDSVVSFEPLPELQRRLRALLPRVRVVGEALSSREGVALLRIPIVERRRVPGRATIEPVPLEVGQVGTEEVRVRVSTLDNFVRREKLGRVGFVKIDVEGHEREVLHGSKHVLERDHPILLVEAEQRHHLFPLSGIFDWLYDHSYEGFFVDMVAGALRPLQEFDPGSHQMMEHHPTRRYVANFIFLPRTSPIRDDLVRRLRMLKGTSSEGVGLRPA